VDKADYMEALGALTYKFYFIFIAFNICITFPTIWFTFRETKRLTLEEIDLLFGGHAAGNVPNNLELHSPKSPNSPVADKLETKHLN
jgi:hypothetical protein